MNENGFIVFLLLVIVSYVFLLIVNIPLFYDCLAKVLKKILDKSNLMYDYDTLFKSKFIKPFKNKAILIRSKNKIIEGHFSAPDFFIVDKIGTLNSDSRELSPLEKDITKIIEKLYKVTDERKSAAWSTSQCNVGFDMENGLFMAENIINKYNFSVLKKESEHCRKLHNLLMTKSQNHNAYDSEGYVSGALVSVAVPILRLENKYNS